MSEMLHRHGHDADKQVADQPHVSLGERLVHHQQDGPVGAEERQRLLGDGERTRGMVWSTEPLSTDPTRAHLRIVVTYKGGQRVEFLENLPNLYQAAPDSPDAKRIQELRQSQQLKHAGKIPKLQLETSAGSMVPVRYDANNPNRLVIDEPALQKKAVDDYIARESKPKDKPAAAQVTGPPWEVPSHCPNCGAPVDQATASRAQDPTCRFCQQPIPVEPLARS
jgi:hypothetical protein